MLLQCIIIFYVSYESIITSGDFQVLYYTNVIFKPRVTTCFANIFEDNLPRKNLQTLFTNNIVIRKSYGIFQLKLSCWVFDNLFVTGVCVFEQNYVNVS